MLIGMVMGNSYRSQFGLWVLQLANFSFFFFIYYYKFGLFVFFSLFSNVVLS